MKDQFSIRKLSIQAGWLDMTILDEEKETVLTASYLSDAISDFAMAIVLLCEGAKERSFIWMSEPGEIQWTISNFDQLASIKVVYLIYNKVTMTCDEEVLFIGQTSLI